MSREQEEDTLNEIEAVQAVYAGDCRVIRSFPPHLTVHLKPRTGDDVSQQFVEADLGIQADAKYPDEPPHIEILDSKGLDERREAHLIFVVQDKAKELASCPMLVALCEVMVEALSNMNHPDGDCPLCLYPLVTDVGQSNSLPFMKLMSCFHCFHSKCIVSWWRWLQEQNQNNSSNLVIVTTTSIDPGNWRSSEVNHIVKQGLGNCPVCRKVFRSEDIEHVLDLVGNCSSQESLDGICPNDDEMEFIHSELESERRRKYAEILRLQEENKGIIVPRRHEVLLTGVLPEPVTTPVASSEGSYGQQDVGHGGDAPLMSDSRSSSSSNMRKNGGHHRRKQFRAQCSRQLWIKKEKIRSD